MNIEYTNDIKRVFFHELGHYFAFKICHRNKPDFKIKAIKIYPSAYENYYNGATVPENSYNILTQGEDEFISHYLMNQFYGIIFQCRFYNKDQKLSIEFMTKYAQNDLANVENYRQDLKEGTSIDHIISFFDKHLDTLKSIPLEKIENLNCMNYMNQFDDNVDVQLLSRHIDNQIDVHAEIYEKTRNQLIQTIIK